MKIIKSARDSKNSEKPRKPKNRRQWYGQFVDAWQDVNSPARVNIPSPTDHLEDDDAAGDVIRVVTVAIAGEVVEWEWKKDTPAAAAQELFDHMNAHRGPAGE